MSEWRVVRLGDLFNVKSSKRIYASEYVEDGVPFYRSREIIEIRKNKKITSPLYISESRYKELAERHGAPKKGDILITSVGTIGTVWFVEQDKFYFKDGNLNWIESNIDEVTGEFIYYWLDSSVGYNNIINQTIGTSQSALTLQALKKLKIYIPNKITMEKISNVLSTYDKLIENNNRRIQILEQTAEELYKEWFVRMRFPGYEKTKFHKGIPEGWEVRRVKDLGEVITGKTPPTNDEENYGGEVMFVKTPDMNGNIFTIETESYLSNKGNDSQPKKLIPEGSIMVSCIGTGGVVSINGYPAHTNQQINSIILNKSLEREWAYFTLRSMKGTIELFGATGATMTNLSKGKFENLKILYPINELVLKYHTLTKGIFSKIKNLNIQNQNLIKQRDLLLPRLMNGTITVK